MTDYCEIVEGLISIASSVVPQTVVIAQNHVGITSDLRFGFTHSELGETIGVASEAIPSQYSVLSSDIGITDTMLHTVIAKGVLTSSAALRTQLFVGMTDIVESDLALASAMFYSLDTPVVVSSIGIASATTGSYSRISETLSSSAAITNTVFTGFVVVLDEAVALASAAFPQRISYALVENKIGIDEAALAGATVNGLLQSSAALSSSMFSQLSTHGVLESKMEMVDLALFRDPDAVAWLLNTETGAASWHTNFGFESIAQVGARTFAVGPEGLYELTGDTDDGEQIAARVKTGFWDFKLEQTKRLDNMYFGYTSPGQLALDVEAAESGYAAQRYLLEPRAASEPRNSRVTPGKGLVSRYWRLTISNKDGVPFHVRSMTADLANSNRRV